ncbi:MAG TPA: DUF2147 domain-containing protein [Pseudomonadales bacterium]
MSAIRSLLLLCTALSLSATALADITGRWKTIDDETGEAKSIVNIYRDGDRYYGRVEQLLLKPADTVCDKCEGERKDKPVVGMVILSDMQADGKEYSGGEILDPAKGKVYRCKLWLEDNNTLKVRGYLAFFYRTQSWYRVGE